MVFHTNGRVAASAQRQLPQLFPQPSWVGHDPMEIWAKQRAVALAAVAADRRQRACHRCQQRITHDAFFNIHRNQWDPQLLKALQPPVGARPQGYPSSHVVGQTTQFGAPIPIGNIAGGQQAALLGPACSI
ncbi:MAG: hypothetical protein LH480_07395 [Rubrivivax sp.]|nr:hypothetical protein [Rubrivivax sp.]